MFESGCFLRESSRFFNVVYGLFFISFFINGLSCQLL